MLNNFCRILSCNKTRAKESTLCGSHKSKFSRYGAYATPPKDVFPVGFIMRCKIHGLLTNVQVMISPPRKKHWNPCKSCRICKTERHKKSKEKNPIEFKLRALGNKLKRKFNMSIDEYNALKISQNNLCKICMCPESAIDGRTKEIRELCIDHCHNTGKVRGLLCHSCNVGIGCLKDDVTILLSAIDYLRPK